MKSAAFLLAALSIALPAAAQYTRTPSPSFGVAGTEQPGSGPQQPKLTQEQVQERLQQMQKALTARLSTCPISMEARQGGGLHIERANRGGKNPDPGMTPTITLRAPGGKHITYANITAYGYSARKWAAPLQTGIDRPVRPGDSLPTANYLNRTLTIRFETDGSSEDSTEFDLPGFSALSFIRLNAITYDDGSVWNVAAPDSCRVKPSGVMLIGGGN